MREVKKQVHVEARFIAAMLDEPIIPKPKPSDAEKVPFRVDSRTVVFIPAGASEEYKQSIREKYCVESLLKK